MKYLLIEVIFLCAIGTCFSFVINPSSELGNVHSFFQNEYEEFYSSLKTNGLNVFKDYIQQSERNTERHHDKRSVSQMLEIVELLLNQFITLIKDDVGYFTNWVVTEYQQTVKFQLSKEDRAVMEEFFGNVSNHFAEWKQDLRADMKTVLIDNEDILQNVISSLIQSMHYVADGDAGSAISELETAAAYLIDFLGRELVVVVKNALELRTWCKHSWLEVNQDLSENSLPVLENFWTEVESNFGQLLQRLKADIVHFYETHQMELYALLKAYINTANNLGP